MASTIDIYDPDLYVEGPIHEIFSELRRTDPVYWQDMPGEPGYWAILKHEDLRHVAKHPELFSAEVGGVVLEDMPPERLAETRNMLLMMDPPRHNAFRQPMADPFKARVINGMEGRIRAMCRAIFDQVGDQGGSGGGGGADVEFVHDVAGNLPSQVVGELVGIPREDWAQIRRWAEMSTSSQDTEIVGDSYSNADGNVEMAIYAMQFAAQRRTEEPKEDLTSLILAGNFGGNAMTDIEFGSFFVQLVTAGNDTTKTMLSSGLEALLMHPEQMAELRADPSLIPGAVEEILRWANPLHYFRRTALADTEVRGVEIKEGDKVAMYYTSVNRDEDVFDDAQAFDIHRSPNHHLSFGIAQHFCLGVHLARLEGKVFFEELLGTFPVIEQTGPSRRVRSNLNNGLKTLPIHLQR